MTDSAPVSPLAQQLHGRYRIERVLGRGGMGTVYLARDLQLDRAVAIKELPAEFAGDALLRDRFLREVRTAAGFSHPNVVPVYGVEADGSTLAYIMGLVEGESLADRVRRTGPLGHRDVVRLLQDIGYALAYAHGRGVVHRDLKPDNIMLERATGRALLMDFGVARTITTAPVAGEGMTRVGEVVGTPEYMSPEQATAEPVDGRSDLYSLGLTAYFALTGAVPFGGDSVQRILVRQLTEILPPLGTLRPDLPPALCAIVDQCLAKDRAQRFANAEAMVDALDAAQLAAPEIALPLRVFTTELETLGLLTIFLLLTALVIGTSVASQSSGWDGMLPVVLLAAVIVGRVLQTRAEASRLRDDGFSPPVIREGIAATLQERDARRAQLRANPRIQARRRRTIWLASLQLAIAPVLMWLALQFRERISDSEYRTGLGGIAILFSALICAGMGLVLLMRSPFRASVSERLVRLLGLGPVSRWLLGPNDKRRDELAPRSRPPTALLATPRAEVAPMRPPRTAATAPEAPTLATIDARLARIEAALAENRQAGEAQRTSQPLR